jgi:hypothetical protein
MVPGLFSDYGGASSPAHSDSKPENKRAAVFPFSHAD